MNKTNITTRGFTIVELLIVVVVIAILAAITIVSYSGITGQAKETALKSALRNAANKVSIEYINNGAYPSSLPGDVDPDSDSYTVNYQSDTNSYCIDGSLTSNPETPFYVSSDTGSVQEGSCGGGTEIANNAPIQGITQAQCDALTTYTGSNEDALRTVQDARGGTTRTYRIAKLADNNCWMLDNLKLGSTSTTTTLTPSDTNIDANFTLPQVATGGSTDHDNPTASGPVPGDTGEGATNYGYLYNWPAATAGESRTTMPYGSGNAPNSICPVSWRLPTGGGAGEFAMLNTKMNNPAATSPSVSGGSGYYQNWQYTGPFKGVFAGYWGGSFGAQGASGFLWSSSTQAVDVSYAHYAYFVATSVSPGHFDDRSVGFGVRCVLD